MTYEADKPARTAAHLGCAAAAGYAALKLTWALGSTAGVRADQADWQHFLAQLGGPMVALWSTVFLALLAGLIQLSLVYPWGWRVPRRLKASLAWLGFAVMTPVGLLRLGQTIAQAIAGDPFPLLTPAVYIAVYTGFVALGLTFAITAWRTRAPAPAPHHAPPTGPSLMNPQECR